ncbi:hypothetical protein T4A_9908 [Trichinella pseudospiralis]|uniref:Uncharacterized protein n=1 Tax=Trichinella pseudospiralis TaxID=6337 RepID=A0A0V1EYZ8_TRIPS|nr:hypothetical protein T4A_9908 [Trichinella pseudospiralis]
MIANCFNYVIMHGYKQLLKYLTDNVAPQDKSIRCSKHAFVFYTYCVILPKHILLHSAGTFSLAVLGLRICYLFFKNYFHNNSLCFIKA